MTGASEGFLGRRLLSIRNSIDLEKDISELKKLRRKEIKILIQLGNLAAAREISGELISENPSWPPGYSIMADLLCRSGRWDEAEKQFEKAASEHETDGNPESAEKLRTGPIYRLAEARGDYKKCFSLCSGTGELKSVLRIRSERLMGGNSVNLPTLPDGRLAARLLNLEKAWRGIQKQELLRTALEWDSTEPEWRWRFIVESINVEKEPDLDKWRKPIRETVCPVLDPRFNKEWRMLSHDR